MSNTGRVFTASLKPAWNIEKIEKFNAKHVGTAEVWIINHDKDTNEKGEIIEVHTHVLIAYPNPRKLSTIANLLECPDNFVELVKSKPAMLRYLTHMDDPDKFQYSHDEVKTNSSVAYKDQIQGNQMSDKEIASMIANGQGYDLLGVVSASKLRTIQSFLAFDQQGKMFQQVREMNNRLEGMEQAIMSIKAIAEDFQLGVANSGKAIADQFLRIANIAEQALSQKYSKVPANKRPYKV